MTQPPNTDLYDRLDGLQRLVEGLARNAQTGPQNLSTPEFYGAHQSYSSTSMSGMGGGLSGGYDTYNVGMLLLASPSLEAVWRVRFFNKFNRY